MRRTHLMPVFRRPTNAVVLCVLSTQQIRERIASECDRAQAIVDIAFKENRDLTAEEKSTVDAILGLGTKGQEGYVPGTIDGLEQDLERAEKLEARQAELAVQRAATPLMSARTAQPDSDSPAPRFSAVRIPAQARFRSARLVSYKGAHAEQTAYAVGQFIRATLGQNATAQQWCRDHGIDIRTALAGNDNDRGGVLVPVEMEQAVIDLREDYGVFRRNAKRTPMVSDTKITPVRKSGVTAYFVKDNQEITASDKQWGNVELVAKKLAALIRYSAELNEDAIISIADDLTKEIAYAFAVKEDDCGFNGDGGNTYGGIVGLKHALKAGSIHEALAGNISFATLDLVDFEAAMGVLPEFPGIQPKWYISKKGYWASMARLMDAAGGNSSENVAAGPNRAQFLGTPVEFVPCLPNSLGSSVSTILAYYGDLQLASLLGDRRGIGVMVSDERYFELDQLGIKGTERVDIVNHSTGDATNAGAVIALKTPGA